MSTHNGVDHSYNISSKESNSERGASSYESNTICEVRNLPSNKLYEEIKKSSRYLCKIRNKYIDLKKAKIYLENQLINSYSKGKFKKVKDENVRLKEQVDNVKFSIEIFLLVLAIYEVIVA